MENLVPVCLGELFAGSYGVKCSQCDNRTWTVWLSEEEYKSIEHLEDKRLIICEKNLGKKICFECRPYIPLFGFIMNKDIIWNNS
jgi:hypothetical protein